MTSGLEDVVVATTRLSHVDGEAGRLVIAGYPVEELAPNVSFEEMAFLLLLGHLPDPAEEQQFRARLASHRALPPAVQQVLVAAAREQAPAMDALRMAAALLSLGRDENPLEDGIAAIAAFPTIVGSYWRLRQGQLPVAVRTDLTHAAHYLHQLFGEEPSAERARAVETYLNTVCDHGLNASTFAARVIVSTRSDVISAITGRSRGVEGTAARRRARPCARHGAADRAPGKGGGVHLGNARSRRAPDGFWTPGVSRARPARRCPGAGGGALLWERRRSSALRPRETRRRRGPAAPARAQARSPARHQRRVLHRPPAARHRPGDRPVHADLRGRTRGRLGGVIVSSSSATAG